MTKRAVPKKAKWAKRPVAGVLSFICVVSILLNIISVKLDIEATSKIIGDNGVASMTEFLSVGGREDLPPNMERPLSMLLEGDHLLNDGTNSFSACLLWMDEYNQLIEWIAFHYHLLPLRNLIIFRDPHSVQNLTPIVDRWSSLINIEVWNQRKEFIEPNAMKAIEKWQKKMESASDKDDVHHASYKIHKHTQREFYRSCGKRLQNLNKTWTAFIDTDERVVLSSTFLPNTTQQMAEPGIVLKLIQQRQQLNETQGQSQYERSCITVRRFQYGAIESPKEYVHKNVPDFLDPYRFQSLRFRHVQRQRLIGKAFGDVSNLNFDNAQMSPHRLIEGDEGQCPQPYGERGDIIRVNHYMGSYEAFQRASDRRLAVNRTERWLTRGNIDLTDGGREIGDEARGWIQGFVDHFGEAASKYLLEDAGFPYNASTAMQEVNTSCGGECLQKYKPFNSSSGVGPPSDSTSAETE